MLQPYILTCNAAVIFSTWYVAFEGSRTFYLFIWSSGSFMNWENYLSLHQEDSKYIKCQDLSLCLLKCVSLFLVFILIVNLCSQVGMCVCVCNVYMYVCVLKHVFVI